MTLRENCSYSEFSGPYFPGFGKCRKIRTRKTLECGHFLRSVTVTYFIALFSFYIPNIFLCFQGIMKRYTGKNGLIFSGHFMAKIQKLTSGGTSNFRSSRLRLFYVKPLWKALFLLSYFCSLCYKVFCKFPTFYLGKM